MLNGINAKFCSEVQDSVWLDGPSFNHHSESMKKIAILQSNYIPWKGYFDIIASVDEFVLYDDMQYTRRDWRNRNQIKTAQGLQWLSVPVLVKGKYHQTINDTEIDSSVNWASNHWKAFVQNYRRAPYFSEIGEWLEPLYLGVSYGHLSKLNESFITAICDYLGIETIITNSSNYSLPAGRTERLASICQQAGATEYVSGPAARQYIEEKIFSNADISLTWFDYDGYVPYPQLWGSFEHRVTILDMLFNCGRDALRYMKYGYRI